MKGKVSLVGYYGFALVGGLLTGGLFSRAMYHKGKADAYNDCAEMLQEMNTDVARMIAEKEKDQEEEA